MALTPLIMLLAIKLVPSVDAATPIPTAENVPEFITEPTTLLVITILVHSCVPGEVAEKPLLVKPTLIPTTSGEDGCNIPETLLPEIVPLFKKPTMMPAVATLSGATVLIRF